MTGIPSTWGTIEFTDGIIVNPGSVVTESFNGGSSVPRGADITFHALTAGLMSVVTSTLGSLAEVLDLADPGVPGFAAGTEQGAFEVVDIHFDGVYLPGSDIEIVLNYGSSGISKDDLVIYHYVTGVGWQEIANSKLSFSDPPDTTVTFTTKSTSPFVLIDGSLLLVPALTLGGGLLLVAGLLSGGVRKAK